MGLLLFSLFLASCAVVGQAVTVPPKYRADWCHIAGRLAELVVESYAGFPVHDVVSVYEIQVPSCSYLGHQR